MHGGCWASGTARMILDLTRHELPLIIAALLADARHWMGVAVLAMDESSRQRAQHNCLERHELAARLETL